MIAIVEARPSTAAELARQLADIPTPSLYRHLGYLVDAGIFRVTAPPTGRPGPSEGIYSANREATTLSRAEAAKLSRPHLRRYFTTFVTAILGDFERYTQRKGYDLDADRVRFRKEPLTLCDDRFASFLGELDELFERYTRTPDEGGRARLFTHICIPQDLNVKESHV